MITKLRIHIYTSLFMGAYCIHGWVSDNSRSGIPLLPTAPPKVEKSVNSLTFSDEGHFHN